MKNYPMGLFGKAYRYILLIRRGLEPQAPPYHERHHHHDSQKFWTLDLFSGKSGRFRPFFYAYLVGYLQNFSLAVLDKNLIPKIFTKLK